MWMVGEEVEEKYTSARCQALGGVIRDADEHGHPVGCHHLSSTTFKAWVADGTLDHFSMQLTSVGEAAHAGAIMALRQAAGRYQVIYSESTLTPEDPDGAGQFAWDVAMGGVMPMIYKMDIAGTPPTLLERCRHLQRFFESTDFTTLDPHDELRSAGTRYVLADPGRSYIAYALEDSGAIGLRALPAGTCQASWLDCLSGTVVEEAHTFEASGDRSFERPSGIGSQCALWVRFPEIKRAVRERRARAIASESEHRINQAPIVADRKVTAAPGKPTVIHLEVSDDDGPGPYSFTIVDGPQHGVLSGVGNDRSYTAHAGFDGTDRFVWRVHDGADYSAAVTVTIRVRNRPTATNP